MYFLGQFQVAFLIHIVFCLPLESSLPFIFFLIKNLLQSYCHEMLWYLKIFLTSEIPHIQLKHLQKKAAQYLSVESIPGQMLFHCNHCLEASQSMKYRDININRICFFCGSRYCYTATTEMTNVNQIKSEGHT